MVRYAIRRILLIFPTLLIASLLVAGMVRILPGDVIQNLAGGMGGTGRIRNEEAKDMVRARLGLDEPFYKQYITWVFGWTKMEGAVYKTSDGGATWGKLGSQTIKPVTQATFISPVLGWALAEEMVYGTDDGGRLWARQYGADHPLHGLAFPDEKNGWAVGDNGTIIHTSEGGIAQFDEADKRIFTWGPQDSGITQHLTDVSFVDAENGWAVGEAGIIIHTVNGGTSWEAQDSSTEASLSAVVFSDAKNGWAVGETGTILTTNDGGLIWSQVDSGTSERLNDISVADSAHLWVVGDLGTVIFSSNGGSSWALQTIYEDIEQNFSAVAFGNENDGMIAGENGTLLSTTDGGATWSLKEIVYTTREGEIGPITKPLSDVTLVSSSSGSVRAWILAVETNWEWGVVGGNLGKRFLRGGEPVINEIKRTLKPSLQLMVMSTLLALVVAIPVGIFSAMRQDTWGDYLGRTVAIGGLAIPSFWLGTMVILIPAYYLGWVPQLLYVPFAEDPKTNLSYFILPTLVGGLPAMAEIMRMTRSMMLEALRQDYIRTAWAKGLKERAVIVRHALKNAAIPVVTLIGYMIPYQLGQLVVVERVFNMPGIGSLLIQGIDRRDLPLIQGVTIFLGVIVVATNLIVDLAYGWLDPRIHYK